MSHIGDGFHRRRRVQPVVSSRAMRTKLSIISITIMFALLLGGCIVRTRHNHRHGRRGCPPGWVHDNGGCHKRGNGPPRGTVKVRDHRR